MKLVAKSVKLELNKVINYLLLTAGMVMMNIASFAQEQGDGDVDVNLNVDDGGSVWYYNIWIWIGLAIFIIIIIAIVSAGKRR